jgi:hypothetical protein
MQLTDDSPRQSRKVRKWTRQCIVLDDDLQKRSNAAAAALGLRRSHLAVAGLEYVVRALEEVNGGPFTAGTGKVPIGRPTDEQRRIISALIPQQ